MYNASCIGGSKAKSLPSLSSIGLLLGEDSLLLVQGGVQQRRQRFGHEQG